MSLALYDEGLRHPGSALSVRFGDGGCVPLDLSLWCGELSRGDGSLLDRAVGRVLDIGCGPGRFTGALAARGLRALGIDLAPAAVSLTRQRGGRALVRSVFDAIPGSGQWDTALLADGNIGIGGDPERLLRRVGSLLRPGGVVLVELVNQGRSRGRVRARIEGTSGPVQGLVGDWFAWAEPSSAELARSAASAQLNWLDSWSVAERGGRRDFVRLTAGSRSP